MSQNAAISNIEVTDGNIKSFERTASKYGLDFALKKDVSVEPPSYLVFFKGRDVDVMTAAFKEFSAKTSSRRNSRPSGTSWIRRKFRARRSIRRRSRSRPRIGVWSCEQARCEEAHSSEPSRMSSPSTSRIRSAAVFRLAPGAAFIDKLTNGFAVFRLCLCKSAAQLSSRRSSHRSVGWRTAQAGGLCQGQEPQEVPAGRRIRICTMG